MSRACQAAPSSTPSVPVEIAAFQLLSSTLPFRPAVAPFTAVSQAARMCSWSPMKWLFSSMNRLVPWLTTMLNSSGRLRIGKDLGTAWCSCLPMAKKSSQVLTCAATCFGSVGRPACSKRSVR